MTHVPPTWPTKVNYPFYCPARGEPCPRGECTAGREYSWKRVFLSIPYDKRYLCYRDAIARGLEEHGFRPAEARDEIRARLVSLPIYECICKSAHAVADLSALGRRVLQWEFVRGAPAAGVLLENAFLRSTMPQVLHVMRSGTKLPTELNALVRNTYASPQELEMIVADWVQGLSDSYLDPMQRILFHENTMRRYHTWFHCYYPKADIEGRADTVPEEWTKALSGGWSGHQALVRAFSALKPNGGFKNTDFTQCEEEPESDRATKQLEDRNLYLLDSPLKRDNQGNPAPLNWAMYRALVLLRQQRMLVPPLTVEIEVIPKGSPEADAHPQENVRLRFGGAEPRCATQAWDYGFIVRAPNPFDGQGMVLIMAGLHAPATHAAAEAVTDPHRGTKLMAKLSASGMREDDPCYFEAAFRVRRTYLKEDLGQLEWLHVVPLSARRTCAENET